MSALAPLPVGAIAAPSPARELWRDFRRNRGAVIGLAVLFLLVFCAIFADVIAPYSPSEQYRDATLHAPSLTAVGGHVFVLGTDEVGRDILSRLIYGTRLSLLIGAVSVGLSLSVGVLLGLVAGFYRGRLPEYVVMRLMDVMLALPSLLLAVAVVAVLGPGLANAMFAIAIVMLPHFVRLTRGAVLGELAKDYVQASRLAGAGTRAADVRHRAAELRRAADRPGDARLLVGDPRCRGARLSRPRRAAADAGVGLDAGERARVHPERVVGRDAAGTGDPRHGARLQPHRRRPARRARPAAEK